MSEPLLPDAPPEDHRRGLKPPQFGVVGLLIFMTLIALVLAIGQTQGPLLASVVALLALAVIAHVAGNAIGTRLRDEGSQPMQAVQESRPKTAESHHFAPTTQLSQKKRIGLPTLLISALFALTGAAAGGALLAHFNWNRLTVANLTLSVVSCGVLAGLWGFWLCSFAKVALHAWQEALRHESSEHVSATPGIDQVLRSRPQED
ncbi:MAG: hypothetical protein AAGF97_02075 [Planctomycetota bacterium]